MPTFSSISLDRLLEPIKRNINMPTVTTTTTTATADRTIHISDSSFSFPPAAEAGGVQNWRNGGSDSSFSFPPLRAAEEMVRNWGNGNGRDGVVRTYEKSSNGYQNGKIGGGGDGVRLDGKGDSSPRLVSSSPDAGDFFDLQESLSVGSSSVEAEGSVGGDRSFRWSAPAAEFYDAYEELSEGSSQSQSYLCDLEADLREKRLNWLMEMDGRKQAEEALETMKRQWERLAQNLSLEGLSLPSASAVAAAEVDPAEELCEQIHLARVVSTFVGSAVGKAAAEKELESKIESKNFEISRLLQRLKYYEAINHEMTQKNQEAIDVERRIKKIQKRRRQRWIWGAVGASAVFGSAALAWYFLPAASESHPNDSYNPPEGDSAAK